MCICLVWLTLIIILHGSAFFEEERERRLDVMNWTRCLLVAARSWLGFVVYCLFLFLVGFLFKVWMLGWMLGLVGRLSGHP
jgi:ABC-type Fe3+ transport system permease subunit